MDELLEAPLLDESTQALALRIAAFKGKPVGDVVRQAIEQAAREAGILKRVRTEADMREQLARLRAIAERSAARPVLDPRHADEIIGYDERGLPV